MPNLRSRYLLDALLTVMLIFEMFYSLTGNVLHELVGVLFCVTIGIHLFWSRKWMRVTAKKVSAGEKLKLANTIRLVLAVLLGIAMATIIVSSLIISNVFFNLTGIDLAGGAYDAWAVAHTVASYSLCALAAVHLAVHWAGVASVLRIPYNPRRREAIDGAMGVLVGVGVVAIGAAGASTVFQTLAGASQAQAAGLQDGLTAGSNPSGSGDGNGALPEGNVESEGSIQGDGTIEGDQGMNQAPDAGYENGFEGGRGEHGGKGRGHGRGMGTEGSEGGYGSGEPGSGYGSGEYGSGSGNGSNSGSGSNRGNGSNGAPDMGGSGSGSDAGNGGSTDGVCTLCRKYCSLSNPKCNKPYRQGLI